MSLYTYVNRSSEPRQYRPTLDLHSSRNVVRLSRSPSPIKQNESEQTMGMILLGNQTSQMSLPQTYKGSFQKSTVSKMQNAASPTLGMIEGLDVQKVISEKPAQLAPIQEVHTPKDSMNNSRAEFATQTDTSLIGIPVPIYHGEAATGNSGTKGLNFYIQPRATIDNNAQVAYSTRESVSSRRNNPTIFGPSNHRSTTNVQTTNLNGAARGFLKPPGSVSDHEPRMNADTLSLNSKLGGSIIGSRSGDFQDNYISIKDDRGEGSVNNHFSANPSAFRPPRLYQDLNNSKSSKASTLQETSNYRYFQPKTSPQAPKFEIFKPLELESRNKSMLQNVAKPPPPAALRFEEQAVNFWPAPSASDHNESFPPTPQNDPLKRNSKIDEIKNFVEELKQKATASQVPIERIQNVAQIMNENRRELERLQMMNKEVSTVKKSLAEYQMKQLEVELQRRHTEEEQIKQIRRSASVETVKPGEYKPVVAVLPPVVRLSAKREASVDRLSAYNGQMAPRVSNYSIHNKNMANYSEKNIAQQAGQQNFFQAHYAQNTTYNRSSASPQPAVRVSSTPQPPGFTLYQQHNYNNASNASQGSSNATMFFDVPAYMPQIEPRRLNSEYPASQPVALSFARDNFFET